MTPADLTMTVLTHPFQVLLMGMVLFQGVRAAFSAVMEGRQTRHPHPGSPVPGAASSHLRAA